MTWAVQMSGTRAADSWRMPIARTMVAVGLAVTCQAAAARAASFSVNPTQIFLSGTVKSALLTLKNESNEPIRFQVSMMAWGQDPSGKMLLEPTEDVVFFPTLLTLGPREERKIRVGTTVAPGAVEKCYRIFVEELPPLETAKPTAGVTMRTKMGVPIFLQPTRASAQARLGDLALTGDHVTFRLLNTGTAHFTPDAVRVRGLDGSGGAVGELAAEAWYVLAEGRRDFDVTVPAARCGEIRSLVVEVQVLGRTLTDTVPAPIGACAKQQ
jgi:fimbrial chaperone protein